MLNDARVTSLGFFKDIVYTARIKKENKFKIKFQVLLKIRPNSAGLLIKFKWMLEQQLIQMDGNLAQRNRNCVE